MTITNSSSISASFDDVIRAISSTLDKPILDADMDTALFDELGLDSTGVLDLLMNLEDETGVEFDTEDLEMEHFTTVGNLVRFVDSLKGD